MERYAWKDSSVLQESALDLDLAVALHSNQMMMEALELIEELNGKPMEDRNNIWKIKCWKALTNLYTGSLIRIR